jgi:hypothetical protein
MNKKRLVIVVLTLLVIFILPLAVSAAETIRVRGKVASATFHNQVDECSFSEATVSGIRRTVNKTEETIVVVILSNWNDCTGEFLGGASSFTTLSDSKAVTIDQVLKSAHLATTVPVYDSFTGEPVGEAQIDLTWTGNGELIRNQSKQKQNIGHCMTQYSEKATFRLADASGSISYGNTEYASGVSQNGGLSQGDNIEMSINCD